MFRDMQARKDLNIRQAKAEIESAARMLSRHEPGTNAHIAATARLARAKKELAEQKRFYDSEEK